MNIEYIQGLEMKIKAERLKIELNALKSFNSQCQLSATPADTCITTDISENPVITYDYDPDYGSIEFYVNLKSVACWSCEGTPKESVEEFAKIFDLGAEYGMKAEIKNPLEY